MTETAEWSIWERACLQDWAHRIIHGPGGMNDYEYCEVVVWATDERVAAAEWALHCLANSEVPDSQEVFDIIKKHREAPRTHKEQAP